MTYCKISRKHITYVLPFLYYKNKYQLLVCLRYNPSSGSRLTPCSVAISFSAVDLQFMLPIFCKFCKTGFGPVCWWTTSLPFLFIFDSRERLKLLRKAEAFH
uniref:Uncharacterized protein n=1 Tax=Arundo donax TaxID=35708 RepID=A0A0A9CLU5_ARUDO